MWMTFLGVSHAKCEFPGEINIAVDPNCTEKVCTPPANVTGAVVLQEQQTYRYTDRIEYKCVQGYKYMSGDLQRQCVNGWTGWCLIITH